MQGRLKKVPRLIPAPPMLFLWRPVKPSMPRPENIPPELKVPRQWIVWKLGLDDAGKPTKHPYTPHATKWKAKSNDPKTWNTFEKSLAATEGFNGVGFVLTAEDPWTVIDLDHCRNKVTGGFQAWAREIISRLNSYTEISPSGGGVHIWTRGKIVETKRKKGNVEIFFSGFYLTMTGHHLAGTPTNIEPRQAELEALHREFFGKPQAPPPKPSGSPALDVSDFALVDKAKSASNGHKFFALWGGDTSLHGGDDSSADLALCSLLAFYTGPDPGRIDRLFRQSGLYREKWERQDYRDRTITKALAGMTEFYTPGKAQERPQATPDEEEEAYIRAEQAAKREEVRELPPDWRGPQVPKTAAPGKAADPWPVMGTEAFYGLAGEFVHLVSPHTESDPVALLAQFLVGFSNQIGRGAYARVEADTHFCNLFVVAMGETAKGRKGTSWGQVKLPLITVDPDWKNRLKSGLSSGEGLIYQVRDPVIKKVATKDKKTREMVYTDEIVDPGEDDKRLLVVESEFANVLRQLAREGNILSVVIRDSWDTGDLATLTKNNPTKATGAHVSIIGHITKDESLLQNSINCCSL